ncbi:ABC transporter ATP-binding protein [Homoserinimonas sp. OAct 916]|uniref:dipeptide ABC transporter ATP-binding protein n=1 Tax=Homoserinimonas sp. OAct 916 TaxID=2211450 RepID=UPI000DBE91D5|nr:ABC transporter ATP-binding protein [Homoserinimonas sp. OAct 916]
MSDVLSIRDLNISFATDHGAVKAVTGLSISVGRGEVLAIVGESGSGKTVTAKAILGLLPETATSSGSISLRNRDGSSANDIVRVDKSKLRTIRGKDVAMVFQEPSTALNPVFKIGWQIIEGLRAHDPRLNIKAARTKAIEILDKVGLPEPEIRVDYYPHQLSGGQKQRVVIAMALVQNPGLIVADEPTTALDVTVQAEILDLLRRCRDEFGASIVLITHNMGVVADLADRVAVMYRGEVVEETDVHSLFHNPVHEYTKKLLAAVPRIGAWVDATNERTAPGDSLASEQAPVVQASNLRIAYPGRMGRPGFVAVDGVDLSIQPGEVVGLVGESGSGKTTIGRAIAGLTKVSGGSLKVLGEEMNGMKERNFKKFRSQIGFVFQDPASSFNPLLTIEQCVAEPLWIHRKELGEGAIRAKVRELLESVQLPHSYGERFPHELSGGQRQRASLARSLALDPQLLIADEPTSALDVSVQARVLELFAELQAELKFAALFISHDLAVVDILSDRIGVLYRGKLVEEGTGAEVLGDPRDPYTRRLLASLPVPDPETQKERRGALAQLRAAELLAQPA